MLDVAISEYAAPKPASPVFTGRYDGETFDLGFRLDYATFNDLLAWLEEKGASDCIVQTNERVKASIGGELHPVTVRPLQANELAEIIRHLYNETGEGLLNRGDDLDGSHEVRDPTTQKLRRYRYNVTAGRIPGGIGYEIVIRTLPSRIIPLDNLGIERGIIENMRPHRGMILITGTTGSGKSTLQASIFDDILRREGSNCRLLTYEDPIEYALDRSPGINSSVWQTEMGKHLIAPKGISENAWAVRNAMRRIPTIVAIGEVRDTEGMEASIKASMTGHLFYSTMHVIGVPAVINQILQYFPFQMRDRAAAEALEVMHMVVTQTLVPRIGGGRVGLREFMVFDEEAKGHLRDHSNDQWPRLVRNMMRERRVVGQTLVDAAWNAYERGDITSTIFKDIANSERRKG